MTLLTLKQLFYRKDGPGPAIKTLLASFNDPVRVTDLDGQLLFSSYAGGVISDEACYPIPYQGNPVGWLFCNRHSQIKAPITLMISTFFDQEMTKKALAGEVLDRYRELTLLYRLSESLISAPDVRAVANTALSEACPLIDATAGIVIFEQPNHEGFETVAACGGPLTWMDGSLYQDGIFGRVLQSGAGELTNNVDGGLFSRKQPAGRYPSCARRSKRTGQPPGQ